MENKKRHSKETYKKVAMIIVLIILLLLLITSCTSNFFGTIGSWFQNEGNYIIDNSTNDKETVRNQELKFERNKLEISLGDTKTKVGFTYENINPKSFTCITSDANIATCYVLDDYVVINPKSTGTVKAILQTETNGKIFEAVLEVTITNNNRYIELSSTYGTIDLSKSNFQTLTFNIFNLSGEINVSSTDESIATAIINKNGVIEITAYKKGTVQIIVSITMNGVTYTAIYTLNVEESVINNERPGTTVVNPEEKKDSDSSLSMIKTNKGILSPSFKKDVLYYEIGVGSWTGSISLEAIASSNRIKGISYAYKDAESNEFKTVDNLKKLKLKKGDNIVLITVTAEDGTKTTYQVVINRAHSSDNYLKKLETSAGSLNPKFNKNTLNYEVKVSSSTNSINLNAIKNDKDAKLIYLFNGNPVKSLDNLNLVTGTNIVNIIVVAEDGSERTYTVKITKESATEAVDSSTLLQSLTDSLGQIKFNPYKTEYHISAPSNVSEIAIAAKKESPNATVYYTFNNKQISEKDLSNLPLNPGKNTLVITVTNNGETRNYTVTITKDMEEKEEGLLNLFTVGNVGTMVPNTFKKDILEYHVYVPEETDKISFNTVKGANTTLLYTYNKNSNITSLKDLKLNHGKNTLIIQAVDGKGNSIEYYVYIHRESKDSNDANIVGIYVDGNKINNYETTISHDRTSVNLQVELDNKNAKILYKGKYYGSLEDIPVTDLKTGENKVNFEVEKEDGTRTPYEITIKKEKKEEIPSNNNKVKKVLVDGENVVNNKVTVENEKESVKLQIELEDKDAKIRYNGKEYSNLEEIPVENLKENDNEITYTVIAPNGEEQDYTLTITRKPKEIISDELSVEIKVKDGKDYTLEQDGPNAYKMTVAYNEDKIPLEVTSNGNLRYKLENGEFTDNLEDLELKDGYNTLIIEASNEETSKTYKIVIYKKIRRIEIEKNPVICYIEDKNCNINYKIKDGEGNDVGTENNNYSVLVSVSSENLVKEIISTTPRVITVIPSDDVKIGDRVSVTITDQNYDKLSTTGDVIFLAHDYTLDTDSDTYVINWTNTNNSKDMILYTNLFSTGNVVPVESAPGYLKICQKNNSNICATLTYDANIIDGLILKENITEEEGITSIPITIVAKNTTVDPTPITIVGSVYGSEIGNKTVAVKITRKFIVTLDAKDGMFNVVSGTNSETSPESNTYSMMVPMGGIADLSKVDTPFKLNEDCTYYEFSHYNTSLDDTGIKYHIVEENELNEKQYTNSMIENVENDMYLYAFYNEEVKLPVTDDTFHKTLWITDPPLFYNEESDALYNEDKMIYPSSKGYYIMNFTNTSSNKVTITGLTLKEDTLCYEEVGCLNMGYIIKFSPVNSNDTYYYYGDYKDNKETYKILYQNSTLTRDGVKGYTNQTVNFSTPIELPVGDENAITISIFWKWVEENDYLDTKIGNIAAASTEESITNMYRLTIGVNFETIIDSCGSN